MIDLSTIPIEELRAEIRRRSELKKELAEQRKKLREHLFSLGIDPPPAKRQPPTENTIENCRKGYQLRRQGLSWREIAQQLIGVNGSPWSTNHARLKVLQWANKNRLPTEPNHEVAEESLSA